jgi:hypothetical protein
VRFVLSAPRASGRVCSCACSWYYTDDQHLAITGGNQCLDSGGDAGATQVQTYQVRVMLLAAVVVLNQYLVHGRKHESDVGSRACAVISAVSVVQPYAVMVRSLMSPTLSARMRYGVTVGASFNDPTMTSSMDCNAYQCLV